MYSRIKYDILSVLKQSIKTIESYNYQELKNISKKVIHNIGIYMDHDSVVISTLIYSLYKLLPENDQIREFVLISLKDLKQSLEVRHFKDYNEILEKLFQKLKNVDDSKLKKHIVETMDQANIKKGAHTVYHGISIARVAKTFGITRWELQNYLGKTQFLDDYLSEYSDNKHLNLTYDLFNEDEGRKKIILFDSGPIITLSLNNLLDVFKKYKSNHNVSLILPNSVKNELIDTPLKTQKFKFESILISKLLVDEVFENYKKDDIEEDSRYLANLANNSFFIKGKNIELLHDGELEVFALSRRLKADAVVVDEATARFFVESPHRIKQRLENKFHESVKINFDNLSKLKVELNNIKVVRSVDLVIIALKFGYLDYLFDEKIGNVINRKDIKAEVLDALLWSLKLNGCSISEKEIYNILELYRKKELVF